MVTNILHPLLKSNTKLVRYDVHHAISTHSANSIIGRAAHIAVLDSEIFIEKFISVSGVKFFGWPKLTLGTPNERVGGMKMKDKEGKEETTRMCSNQSIGRRGSSENVQFIDV